MTSRDKFKGGTKEQYDASIAVVHPPEGLPDGQIHHFAGETQDGWIVVAIRRFERRAGSDFATRRCSPARKFGEKGLPGPPEETTFEVEVEEHA